MTFCFASQYLVAKQSLLFPAFTKQDFLICDVNFKKNQKKSVGVCIAHEDSKSDMGKLLSADQIWPFSLINSARYFNYDVI